jgi:hypothetical protein
MTLAIGVLPCHHNVVTGNFPRRTPTTLARPLKVRTGTRLTCPNASQAGLVKVKKASWSLHLGCRDQLHQTPCSPSPVPTSLT